MQAATDGGLRFGKAGGCAGSGSDLHSRNGFPDDRRYRSARGRVEEASRFDQSSFDVDVSADERSESRSGKIWLAITNVRALKMCNTCTRAATERGWLV